ncbi:hypothetical protein, partial [Salmonella sp. M205]|uniref:hypothetical protein n=1 Tax=Salmonella sp. M205 TaxID=3240294 RepID=UPI00352B90B5
ALSSGSSLSDPVPYRRLIGRLIYLTITKPDISYGVHILSQFMSNPTSDHWHAGLRLVKYLKGSPGQGVFFPANASLTLTAFCDSD